MLLNWFKYEIKLCYLCAKCISPEPTYIGTTHLLWLCWYKMSLFNKYVFNIFNFYKVKEGNSLVVVDSKNIETPLPKDFTSVMSPKSDL